MKKFYLFIYLFFSVQCFCQYKVQFIVTDSAMYKAEKIYAAGNFNGWQPADKNYEFTRKKNNKWELILPNIAKGNYSFKFTKGSWQTVEDSTNGMEKANRQILINSDTTFYCTTLGWWLEDKPRNHTASTNVHILADSFYMPQLNRKRKIWIYLPSNYTTSKQKYPVLYMHDAQNLFDESTAPYGEWGVDEALDTLQKQTGKYCIVVGIEHGGDKRLVEYNPYNTKEYGLGEGEEYAKFLVNTLKPFIDNNYRTKLDAKNTAIAGSSLGGLISMYIKLKYPSTFGAAGIFSPAFWIAPELTVLAKKSTKVNNIWFYGGSKEGFSMKADMMEFKKIIDVKKGNNIVLQIDENGQHNEVAWRKWFPSFYAWWLKK